MKLAKILDAAFFTRDEEDNATGPSWKYRRKLIYGGYRLGFAMVIFGALTFLVDQWGVGTTLITGGVSLITIILTAYTATATFEDVKLRQSNTEQKEP
jgi:polyferredoxin